MIRAVKGYGFALVIGAAIGIAAAQSRILRAAVSSILTGLQTMPTIAWLPAIAAVQGPRRRCSPSWCWGRRRRSLRVC